MPQVFQVLTSNIHRTIPVLVLPHVVELAGAAAVLLVFSKDYMLVNCWSEFSTVAAPATEYTGQADHPADGGAHDDQILFSPGWPFCIVVTVTEARP